MTIEELYKKNKINVRLYNICTRNKFESIDDLKRYYLEHTTFINLRNCGRKSNEELVELCIKYEGDFYEIKTIEVKDESSLIKEENPLKSIVSRLTLVQREVINNFIYVNSNYLTVRSKNGILHYLNGNLKIKNFAEKILFDEYFDAKDIKNVGQKSVEEIDLFILIVKEYLIEISKFEDEESLLKIKNKFLMECLFPNSNVPNSLLESASIFPIVQFLLDKYSLFDKTKTVIVKSSFKIFNKQEWLTLDEIAEIVDLSRERVRQLRGVCLKEMYDNLAFIQNFDEDLYQKYSIDTGTNYINIDDNTVEIINAKNKTLFSKEFIMYILYVYLHDNFLLVGNIEDVLQIKYFNSRNRHNWKSFYLINTELAQEFDFENFTSDIHRRINSKIDKTYSFNFKSYLSGFLKTNNIDYLNELSSISEHIINTEFELYLNLNEELIFKRNTIKSAYEYAFEALEEIGEPSHINEIYKKVSEIHPNYDTNEEKLRSAMQREKIFTPISRTSVYGLKKWENKWEDFKGGSIRDIVIEKLIKSNRPLHIVELLNEVHKYREETNIRNLITNLKLENNNTFVFYNQSFVGLSTKNKKYDLYKYENIPIQLGKEIISKHKQDYSVDEIKIYLKNKYDLSFDESELIITNLDYFNESK